MIRIARHTTPLSKAGRPTRCAPRERPTRRARGAGAHPRTGTYVGVASAVATSSRARTSFVSRLRERRPSRTIHARDEAHARVDRATRLRMIAGPRRCCPTPVPARRTSTSHRGYPPCSLCVRPRELFRGRPRPPRRVPRPARSCARAPPRTGSACARLRCARLIATRDEGRRDQERRARRFIRRTAYPTIRLRIRPPRR